MYMARARRIADESGAIKTPEAFLAETLQAIVDQHDKQANEDVPPVFPEDGLMTCGCWTCQKAKDALAAVGR
jgi:hypothetical protein